MGRLTEAYGFVNVSVKEFNKKWLLHNITSLEPSEQLYSIRKQIIRLKRIEKSIEDEKDN